MFLISVDSSVKFIHNIPELAYQNIPYKIVIRNMNLEDTIPFQDFVLSIELRNPSDDEIFGIIPVTKPDFKSMKSRGFSIGNYSMNEETITMMITFGKEAHDRKLIVRFSRAKTETQKMEFFDSKIQGQLFQRTMKMYLPISIKLRIMPDTGVISALDKDEVGDHLIPGKYGLILCKASTELDDTVAEFVNPTVLRNPEIKEIKIGIVTLQWEVSLGDNGKIIQCRSGGKQENITLTVYHYLSEVLTSPPIDNKISRNSQVKCINNNGYPTPKMSWVFLTGPPEAWKFYQLRDNDVTLFINASAPINTNWSFQCQGLNEIPPVVQKYLPGSPPNYPIRRIYNFTVIEADVTALKSQTGTVITIVIAIIILFAIIAIIVTKGSKIRSFLMIRYSRVFKSETELAKSEMIDHMVKYSGDGSHQNGKDETQYAVIIATVQPKMRDHDYSDLGPIDRV